MTDLSKVMEREQLHSEHAAKCFIEAGRKGKRRPKCLRDPKHDHNMQGPCSAGQCQWPNCKPDNSEVSRGAEDAQVSAGGSPSARPAG
jgi:hypothetical protein